MYDLNGYKIKPVESHNGGRNIIFNCEKDGYNAKILRISFLKDRTREHRLGEVEYIRYLYANGGSVSNVISSNKNNLLEEINYNNHTFYICLFEKAKGKRLPDNNYDYREGVPVSEYFYNCGKTLGKLHQISKNYIPIHRRYSFLDIYNSEYINSLIPDSHDLLKEKMFELLNTLEELPKNRESFGMVHLDYNDGNYSIDYETGQLTVYDFDNSCFFWYMFDLAGVWESGTGWIQSEKDIKKRKKFMKDYFKTVLDGYRSETTIDDLMLDNLPLFINIGLMEGIIGQFEYMRDSGEGPDEEWLPHAIKCLEEDIPYYGFFH